MARGRYDLPQGYSKPTYGPRRPPTSPVAVSITPTAPNPTPLPIPAAPFLQSHPTITVVSLPTCGYDSTEIAWLRTQLNGQVVVESVGGMNEAIIAFSRRPSAVLVPKTALTDQLHGPLRLAAAQYVQSGGILVTESCQIPAFLEHAKRASLPVSGQPRDATRLCTL